MMANGDQPPAPPAPQQQLPESGGPSAGDQILHILKAVGYGLGNMVGEVRAGRERQAAMLTNMAYHNPSLLDEPHGAEFRSAFKKTTGLSDEGIAALRAHGRIKGLLEELAGQAGVPLTQPDYGAVSPYDRAIIARQATTEAPVSQETLGVVRGNLPQVQRAPAEVMSDIQEKLPSGVKLTGRIDPKTGQPIPTLAIGKTGALGRLQEATQLWDEFLSGLGEHQRQLGRELTISEVQDHARGVVADAAKRNMAAPERLTAIAATTPRALSAAAVTGLNTEAMQHVMLGYSGPRATAGALGQRGLPTPWDLPGLTLGAPGAAGAPGAPPPTAPPAGPPARGAAASQAIGGTLADYKRQLDAEVTAGRMTEDQSIRELQRVTDLHVLPEGDIAQTVPPGQPSPERPAGPQQAAAPQAGALSPQEQILQYENQKAVQSATAKYAAKRNVSIGEAGETVVYPTGSKYAGRAVERSANFGDAIKQGGIPLSPDAAKNFHTLQQATDFLQAWPQAANVLFQRGDNSPFYHSLAYKGIQMLPASARRSAINKALELGAVPMPTVTKRDAADNLTQTALPNTPAGRTRAVNMYADAITKIEEIRNNFIIPLRSGMGERGNFAKSIVDHALLSGPTLFDDAVTAGTRMRFMFGLMAAGKLAQGIPLTNEEVQLYRGLDKDAEASGLTDRIAIDQKGAEYGLPPGSSIKDVLLADFRGGGPPAAPGGAASPRQQLEQMLEHYAPRPAAQ